MKKMLLGANATELKKMLKKNGETEASLHGKDKSELIKLFVQKCAPGYPFNDPLGKRVSDEPIEVEAEVALPAVP